MRSVWKAVAWTAGVFALANPYPWEPGRDGLVRAQEESKPVLSDRGGLLLKEGRYQFEVFFYNTGLRVFPRDAEGSPLDASKLTGTATFYHPNSPDPWFARPIRGAAPVPGQAPTSLDLAIGLSKIPPSGAKVTFEIAVLPDPNESIARFTVPFTLVKAPAGSVAVHPAPSPSRSEAVTSPRYVYGPGYYGYGYYENARPRTRSVPSGPHNYATTPGMFGPGGMTVGPYHRDWTTGRETPIAKPWLRPFD
jgi:hypothetical protein